MVKTVKQIELEKRNHDALLDYLEAGGYDIDCVLANLNDEVIAYAENEGYHYCDDCDERLGDPSDRY
jgi:hypothetical protein